MFENKEVDRVLGSSHAPAFNALARRYAVLADYTGVAHPSLGNYLALVSGSTQGASGDCTSCVFTAQNLADTLEAHRRSWKTYAEGLPAPGFTGGQAEGYEKDHDPFLYFSDVLARPDRLARIVPLTDFGRDLAAGALPEFSLVVPSLCHSMHDCSVAEGDAWLRSFVQPLLGSRGPRGTAVFVLFDEGSRRDAAGGGGHVAALVLGGLVRPGARASAPLDHYSVLRTIEQAWRLPYLGRSAAAAPIAGIWRR